MGTKKILIVDDDKDLVRGLMFRLKANGYETAWAFDGYSAMSTAKKEKPDLIILDLGLPIGSGFSVMERLKSVSSLAFTPVIVLTAREIQINKERALQDGAVAFFQKPADNEALLAAIRSALGESDK
jgi:DNA-binding response OmpR family regulator